MFNIIKKDFRECDGIKIYTNDAPSFIKTVQWDDFMRGDNYNYYIEDAIEIKNASNLYDVHINIE